MIAACATHIPLKRLPAHVVVIRDGRRLTPPHRPKGREPTSGPTTKTGSTTTRELFLQVGDQIRVSRPATFTFSYAGNRFHIAHGQLRLECRNLALDSKPTGPRTVALAVWLQSGRVQVRSGVDARRALVLGPEMLAYATVRGTNFIVDRNPRSRTTRTWTLDQPIVAARASDETLRINTRLTYTAISNAQGLSLDIWPFPVSQLQRPTTPADGLPPFWADGLPCSVGCTAPGAIPGWPLQPFHEQHAIRAGINELRPANFHVAVDIEARDFQPVYAIQSGYAYIRYAGTGDVNVDVGSFDYWHIYPSVSDGQYVVAYQTVLGTVINGFWHVALSEGSPSDYLNPLRPGGSLQPYTNTEPPIIGTPRIFSDGRVIVGAFGPQSFVQTGMPYETPVLAPSSLAWRLYDARGNALTGLEWAMRGSQNYPPGLKTVIFAPGASNPGFWCFYSQVRCIPNWVYWLAGGLTQPLPLAGLPSGRYRLTVYAWDWAGNTSALDYWIKLPLANAANAARAFGPLSPNFDYDETGVGLLTPPATAPFTSDTPRTSTSSAPRPELETTAAHPVGTPPPARAPGRTSHCARRHAGVPTGRPRAARDVAGRARTQSDSTQAEAGRSGPATEPRLRAGCRLRKSLPGSAAGL